MNVLVEYRISNIETLWRLNGSMVGCLNGWMLRYFNIPNFTAVVSMNTKTKLLYY